MKYQKLKYVDIANGPGCRVTIWESGCGNNCPGCFNEEAKNPDIGEDFTEETMNDILEHLKPDYISGFTFLGGDPLFLPNCGETLKIAKRIKEVYGDKKTIWLWTGYLWENVKDNPVFKYVDVCVDGPFIEEQKDITLVYSGSRNQRVINVQESLKNNKIILL